MCVGSRFLGYAMQYLPGMHEVDPSDKGKGWSLLQNWLSKKPSGSALEQVQEVARSQLNKAHAIPVDFGPNFAVGSTAVHGDLRPCNIAVLHSGESATVTVSFLDFGFAGLASETAVSAPDMSGAR